MTFIESRLARRIVLLFISCALLPVTVLAVVSFYEVTSQLRQESQRRLTQATKTQGMLIYEHLQMLDSDLRSIANQIEDGGPLVASHLTQEHIIGLAIFSSDGHPREQWGEAPTLAPIDDREQKHLLSGSSLIETSKCRSVTGTCVLMVRLLSVAKGTNEFLIAELNPKFLWAANGLSSDLQFCVLSSRGENLFCSDERSFAGTRALPEFRHASGFFNWQDEGKEYDTAYWKLLIKPLFFEDEWTIAVNQEHASVLAPVKHFQSSFSLVILLSFWIVLLLSMILVRRTLVPLQKLQAGTGQIAARRFDSRVEVHSGDEFEELATSFNSMATQLGRQFQTLSTIREIDEAIFASLNREEIIDGVLARMPGLLASECFAVCIFEPTSRSGQLRYRAAGEDEVHTKAFALEEIEQKRLREYPLALTISTREGPLPAYLAPLADLRMQCFLVLSIQVENSIYAALVCANTSADAPPLENFSEARQVADQLAVAFAHAKLIKALEQLHLGALTALARAIDAKSEWTAGHSERVTHLAIEIGRHMGLSAKDLKVMHMGGLLHDIGKIGTPPSILDKPGKLTDEEMRTMQEHVRTGVRILEPIPDFAAALPIVAQHHEWFNGRGYPAALAGKEINIYARIFAVADCYDALTSDRPYRKGLPKEQTVAMLRDKSGIQFDPEVIEAFIRMLKAQEIKNSGKVQGATAGQPL